MPAPTRPRSGTGGSARSLADDVRSRSDEQLATLLRRRPDLARPTPADLTSLAARAATRASVQRAVDGLDRAHLSVLRELVTAGDPLSEERTARVLSAPREQVSACLEHLRALALVWDAADGPHVVRTASELLAPTGGSSSRPGAPTWSASAEPPARTDLATTNPASDRGEASSAASAVFPRRPASEGAPGDAGSPAGEASVERGLGPPPLRLQARLPESVDQAGGAAAADLLALVGELAHAWERQPPRVLRSGGLAVRDLRRLATRIEVGVDQAAFVVEVAYIGGLVAEESSSEPGWAPTPMYDEWAARVPPERWAMLATLWLGSPRAAHRVGTAPPEVNGTINALSPGVLSSPSRQVRLEVLAELALLSPGEVPDTESLIARLAWRRPLRPAGLLDQAARAALRDAEWLGVTGRGGLTRAGSALVTGARVAEVAALMAAAMPAAVGHVVLQADLTAIAPGRLDGELAQLMRLVADVESRGAATVYRLSAGSVRRAMDAGWSADQLLAALRAASATAVPQPLEYLVGDVARRHGATRVGAVSSYLRSDDPGALDAMAGERGLASLQLRRIAPTVLVSSAAPSVVLELLRDNGLAPVAEGLDGAVRVPRPPAHRAASRRPPPAVSVTVVDDEAALSLVRSLRSAEAAAAVLRQQERDRPGPALPTTDPTVALALIREAVAARRPIWIGYADSDGQVTRHLFWPRRVEGGRAYGMVDGTSTERAFSIHRITGASVG